MSVRLHLSTLPKTELVDLFRFWSGSADVKAPGDSEIEHGITELMTDRPRILERYRELPPKCREFLDFMLAQEDYALPMSRLEEDGLELPIRSFEVESVGYALKKRGFLTEAKERTWFHYQEPVLVVPSEVGDALVAHLGGPERTLETQLNLRAYLRQLPREELSRRLIRIGLSGEVPSDRATVVNQLAKPATLKRALEKIADPKLREIATHVLEDHAGLGEIRHLSRLGYEIERPDAWREALEENLLGTILDGDLTDVGLQLGRGSLLLFLDLIRGSLQPALNVSVDEEPPPEADLLADLSAIRTFLDHHSVRVTKEGTLYRATLRKMETELLTPGHRPVNAEAALEFILRFMTDAELLQPDADGRMRTTRNWKGFEARGPVEKLELILTYIQNDVRDAQGPFHQPRLRRMLLNVLSEAGREVWVALRPLAQLARNRYFATLDRPTVSDRFQKRYKYAQIPQLPTPAVLVRELIRFAAEPLALAGIVSVASVEDQPLAVRLTKLGAAVLGLPDEAHTDEHTGALIVTADYEIVLFPETGGIALAHEIGRFARREKADYSVHYRISERSIQEAVASGLTADEIMETLRRHGRFDLPKNVAHSIRTWASSVNVLTSKRTMLLRALSPEALDQALKIREFKAIAGERLTPTTVEVSEDPANPRISEALRAAGFFLR